jgi:hypothetical protein
MSLVINGKEHPLLNVADINKYNNQGVTLHPSSIIMLLDKQSREWIASHKHLGGREVLLRNE